MAKQFKGVVNLDIRDSVPDLRSAAQVVRQGWRIREPEVRLG